MPEVKVGHDVQAVLYCHGSAQDSKAALLILHFAGNERFVLGGRKSIRYAEGSSLRSWWYTSDQVWVKEYGKTRIFKKC